MIRLGRWSKRAGSALLISMDLAGCGSSPATAPSAGMQQRIEAAQTRADHEALAEYYERAGAAARVTAGEHRQMARSYERYQPGRGGGNMAAHCNAIVRSYEGLATQYDKHGRKAPPDGRAGQIMRPAARQTSHCS